MRLVVLFRFAVVGVFALGGVAAAQTAPGVSVNWDALKPPPAGASVNWNALNAAASPPPAPGAAVDWSALDALPLVAAGVATTCMAFGGLLMAYIAGSELDGKYPLPTADLLRLSNGLGFIVTGIPGMAAAALCIAVLAGQARRAEVFGPKMAIFTWIVAAALLFSFLFLPIAGLMAWIVVCILSARRANPRLPVSQPTVHAAAVAVAGEL